MALDPQQLSPQIPPRALVVFDIDGVVRDVSQSYRRAIADTVEHFTQGAYRPTLGDMDTLKAEGVWNNDWLASQELIYRYWDRQGDRRRTENPWPYAAIVDYFQRRYRGQQLEDPQLWDGYITQEPLLMQPGYLGQLAGAGVAWGFFSGATRGSADYVLRGRLGLEHPPLVAMGEAPDKPDPKGLYQVVVQLEEELGLPPGLPVVYVGDTVADMYTATQAQSQRPGRVWRGVGVLPPHVQATDPQNPEQQQVQAAYGDRLIQAGAVAVLSSVMELTGDRLESLL